MRKFILFVALLIAWVAGSISLSILITTRGNRHEVQNLGTNQYSLIYSRTNPPPGYVILCDGEGHFLPLVEGKHKFIVNPVSTNYSEAVARLWGIYDLSPEARDERRQLSPEQFSWKKCDE